MRETVIRQWRELRDYARRLVDELDENQMVAQPIAGVIMNHPAWALSHLGAYGPVLAGILRNEAVLDPVDHEFGRKSEPMSDPRVYLSPAELIEHFAAGYDDAAIALREADPAILKQPVPVERWRARFPCVADLPTQFMIKHVGVHLGQVSAWRRAMGLPRV